jgi:hypothetical protein
MSRGEGDQPKEYHKRVFRALVEGAPGSSTTELHALYDAIAPLVYEGRLATPVSSRRYRRDFLDELRMEDVVAAFDVPGDQARVWIPIESGTDERETVERATRQAQEARP